MSKWMLVDKLTKNEVPLNSKIERTPGELGRIVGYLSPCSHMATTGKVSWKAYGAAQSVSLAPDELGLLFVKRGGVI